MHTCCSCSPRTCLDIYSADQDDVTCVGVSHQGSLESVLPTPLRPPSKEAHDTRFTELGHLIDDSLPKARRVELIDIGHSSKQGPLHLSAKHLTQYTVWLRVRRISHVKVIPASNVDEYEKASRQWGTSLCISMLVTGAILAQLRCPPRPS